jgi:hypothetical protein
MTWFLNNFRTRERRILYFKENTMPPIQNSLDLLTKETKDKYLVLLTVCKEYWLMIKSFETKRTIERQKYLYSIWRTILLNKKPVTRTINSLHLEGKAVDSAFVVNWQPSRTGDWSYFRDIAERCWFAKIPNEKCHTQNNWVSIKNTMLKNSALAYVSNSYTRKILHSVNQAFRSLGY